MKTEQDTVLIESKAHEAVIQARKEGITDDIKIMAIRAKARKEAIRVYSLGATKPSSKAVRKPKKKVTK